MNIQKISLRDVVFSGIHGATDREQEIPQRFSSSLDVIFDASTSINSEQLSDTIDYFDLISVMGQHIENKFKRHILLETLVEDLANDLGKRFNLHRVELSIQKLDVPFSPKIKTIKNYFSRKSVMVPSFEHIHESLVNDGAVSIPFLTREEREELLEATKNLDFIEQPRKAESGIVEEELSSCMTKDESSVFLKVADRVALFLSELTQVTGQNVPVLPKAHVAIQKYPEGSIGITPHRDEKKYGVTIAVIPLAGEGVLATCTDRVGSNQQSLDTTLGNLMLLRAPGYAGMHVRPMHVVHSITKERIVLGIRFPTNE